MVCAAGKLPIGHDSLTARPRDLAHASTRTEPAADGDAVHSPAAPGAQGAPAPEFLMQVCIVHSARPAGALGGSAAWVLPPLLRTDLGPHHH